MNNLSDEVLATAKRYAAEVCKKDDAMYILDLVTFAAELLQQNFCKPGVVGCKELLAQMLIEAEKAKPVNVEPYVLGKAIQKIGALRAVIKMLDELPAL